MDKQFNELLHSGQYSQATLLLERNVLNNNNVPFQTLERLPFEYLSTSPNLMFILSEKLLNIGRIIEAKQLLSDTLKKFAEFSIPSGFLKTLAILCQVHIRLGNDEEAKYYLQYLKDEYHREESVKEGIIPLTLALGTYYLPDGNFQSYLVDAFRLYREANDVIGMSTALVELILQLDVSITDSQWKHLFITFQHITKFNNEWNSINQFVKMTVSFQMQNWENSSISLSPTHMESLPLYYQYLFWYIHCFANKKIGKESKEILNIPVPLYNGADLSIQLLSHLNKSVADPTHNNTSDLISLYELCKLPLHKKLLESHLNNDKDFDKSSIEIFVLKGFRVRVNSTKYVSIQWKRKKAQEILIFLLLQSNYSISKDKLIDALFPNSSIEKSNNQLRVALHHLNQIFSEHLSVQNIVQTQGGHISLNDNYNILFDGEEYLQLVKTGDQLWSNQSEQEAVHYYNQAYQSYGTFMDGFDYLDWILEVRQLFQTTHVELVRKLAHYSLTNLDYHKAEFYYKEAISIDVTNEDLYQELIGVLSKQSKSYELKQWQGKLKEMLKNEYDIEE